jgi:hypothetical protein
MIVNGDGFVYSDSIGVTDNEFERAVDGTFTALIRVGSQGVSSNNLQMETDSGSSRNIQVTKNYVTQFYGLTNDDAATQGLDSADALKSLLRDNNGGIISDSQPITVIYFRVM